MVKKARRIVWDKQAISYLRAAVKFIRKDSALNADVVKTKIIGAISELAEKPLRHNDDKYRINNDGSYREFEIFRFRIAYYVSKDQIRIVRIRHTSQEPTDY